MIEPRQQMMTGEEAEGDTYVARVGEVLRRTKSSPRRRQHTTLQRFLGD